MSLSEYLPRRIDFQYCAPFMHELIEFSLTNSMHNGEDHCIMELKNFKLSSFEETKEKILIEYKYFKEIYDRLMDLNFNKILIQGGPLMGLDGSSLKIYIEYGSNYLSFCIWCHDSDIENRGLVEINNIFNDFLKRFNMNPLNQLSEDEKKALLKGIE